MANFERGVYEPSDEVRVFDGSEDEDDVEGSRLPLLIVLALLVLAMFAGVVWLAYTQGVARGRGETPVLAAASGPERVAPQAGGNTVPYQGFKIYEQPAPPDDSADAAPSSEVPAPKPAQSATPPAAPPKAAAVTPLPKPATATPVATSAPPKPVMPPKSVAALIQQANSVPEPSKPAPVAKSPLTNSPAVNSSTATSSGTKPVTAAAATSAVGTATGAPRPLVVAAKPAPQATAPITAAAGSYVLQIGAYKSQADADTAWKSYKAKHAALLSGYSNNVQQVDLGEKGTWYRLRIGGFADREVASALCERLKVDGGACILNK